MINLGINTQVLLDSIGLVQGSILGIVLMVLNRHKYRSTFFLGLFLVCFSLELAVWIFKNPELSESYPSLFLLPFNFSWLLFPLFFLYTQQVSVLSKEKTKYWVLYPGIVLLVFQGIIFWLPFETKQVIDQSAWHKLIFWQLGDYYSWIICSWNLWLLNKHRVEVRNTYSFLASKELQWARVFLFYLLIISVTSHIIAYIFPNSVEDNTIFSFMDLIAIYWASYLGLMQRNVHSLLSANWISNDPQHKPIEKPEESLIMPERLEELLLVIEDYMKTSECFIDPELTIADLGVALTEHPKLVSNAINTISKQNFNTYVNQFRIKKAVMLLSTNEASNLSMEGICKEVGFNSKSAFYTAFKKETGTTPSKFKEKVFN